METQTIPDVAMFLSIFSLVYLIGYFIVFRNWSPKTRPEASSCLISLFHGTPAVLLATRALLLADPRYRGFSSPNTAAQASVLEFSVAYFLADLVHYIIFYPSDILFIAHHVATLFVFLTCRYVALRGACAILGLLVLAEVTSACQNVWTLARMRRQDSPAAAKLYGVLSPPFYAFYSVVRGLLGPLFVYKMGVSYASKVGDGDVIPTWLWVSWMLVVVTAIGVSILWIWNLWMELYMERKVKLNEKKVR